LTSAKLWLPFFTESELDMAPGVKNRVKDLRCDRGWTQQELAEAVGVSRQSINAIERNRYVPSLPLALMFARVFRCSADRIFMLEHDEWNYPLLASS
jgi:putative transcriptional regulator